MSKRKLIKLKKLSLKSSAKKKDRFEVGSGNVFKDLGLKDSSILQLKSSIASKISHKINKSKMSKREFGETYLDIRHSAQVFQIIKNGSKIKLESLLKMVNNIGYDVEVKLKKSKNEKGSFNFKDCSA